MAGLYAALGAALSGTLASIVLCGAAAGEASLQERLGGASTERGREVFRVCGACHTIDAGAAHTVGPNLWGVIGRPVATAEGFDRYSPAMASLGGAWTPERLDRYLRRPAAMVEGTTMVYPGVPDGVDRADLIAWLGLNSSDPADFASKRAAPKGTVGAVGAVGAHGARPPAPQSARSPDFGVLVAGEGARETHAYCTACHSERIVAQQGLTRADWEELLEQMIEENGMTPIEEPDLGRVLAYLSAHYGTDRPNFPRP